MKKAGLFVYQLLTNPSPLPPFRADTYAQAKLALDPRISLYFGWAGCYTEFVRFYLLLEIMKLLTI